MSLQPRSRPHVGERAGPGATLVAVPESRLDTVAGAREPESDRDRAASSRPLDADSDIDDSFLLGIAAAPPIELQQQALLVPGTHVVGKYRIESRIGQGGMGTVYRATDTRLQRPVAIKIHHGLSTRVERLRREARLLARLSHPNVVTVLEVGTHAGMLFVAMEYVDGGNARSWRAARPRHWREIVELYRQAGRGLAAAHALGIVHRDFKPDNVLVGVDGRARVADFGLAGPAIDAQASAEQTLEAKIRSLAIETEGHAADFATEAGVIVGTPAYVAPEQILSSRVDARADQFGFCAALFEALYGSLPFPGESAKQIIARIAGDQPVSPRDLGDTPPWLLEVLERGMAHEPVDRFADMNALLAALAGPPRARRWTRALALGGVLALAGAAFSRAQPTPTACADEPEGARWSDRGRQLGERVAALGDPATTEAWTHLEPRLRAHAEAWSSVHTAVCEAAATDEDEADVRRRERELACLADAASPMDALLAELAEPALERLARATEVAERLPDPTRCIGAMPSRKPAPPPELAADVDALRPVLEQARTQLNLGQTHQALALSDIVVARAHELGFAPLVVDARIIRASARMNAGALDAGREDAHAAFEEAQRAEYQHGMGLAADLLAHVAFTGLDFAEALRWNDEARRTIKRLPDEVDLFLKLLVREAAIHVRRGEVAAAQTLVDEAEAYARQARLGDELVATVELGRGGLAEARGDYGSAVDHYERARGLLTASLGAWSPRVAAAWSTLGTLYLLADNYVEAKRAYERALEILTRTDDSPYLMLRLLHGIAAADDMLGDGEAALRRLDAARELFERSGADDVHYALMIAESRGVVLIGLGRGEEALASLEPALTLAERIYGDAHAELRSTLASLALAAREAGRSELAEQYLQRALRISSSLDREDEQAASLLHSYGFLLLEREQLDAAAAQFERAGNLIEQLSGLDSADMGWVELGRGRIAIARGDFPLARLSLERADALWSGDEIPPEDRADMQADLAVALWETGERARAVAIARAAAEVRPDDPKLRAWLAAHPAK